MPKSGMTPLILLRLIFNASLDLTEYGDPERMTAE